MFLNIFRPIGSTGKLNFFRDEIFSLEINISLFFLTKNKISQFGWSCFFWQLFGSYSQNQFIFGIFLNSLDDHFQIASLENYQWVKFGCDMLILCPSDFFILFIYNLVESICRIYYGNIRQSFYFGTSNFSFVLRIFKNCDFEDSDYSFLLFLRK